MDNNKQDVVKDYGIFTTAGRKDWKLMLESRKKAAKEKEIDKIKHATCLGHQTNDVKGKVIAPEIGKGKKDRPREKDAKEIDEATVAPAAGGTNQGAPNDGVFAGRLGMGVTKRPLNEVGEEVIAVGVEIPNTETSPKIDSIEKKRAKLEQQMVDLEEEKLRVIKLSELATQKAALQEQLAAIKEEMAEVKSGKGEKEKVETEIPSAEENAEHAEGETEESEDADAEEKEESEEESEEDSEEDDSDEKVEKEDDK